MKQTSEGNHKRHDRGSVTEKKHGPSRKASRANKHSKGIYSARMNNSIECIQRSDLKGLNIVSPDKVIDESISDHEEKSLGQINDCKELNSRDQYFGKLYESSSPFKRSRATTEKKQNQNQLKFQSAKATHAKVNLKAQTTFPERSSSHESFKNLTPE